MPLSITCNSCGTIKPLDAFERLPSGGHRGVCIACRQAASAAYRRAVREAQMATPEHMARMAQRQRDKEARAAKKEADRAAAAEATVIRRAKRVAERAAQRETVRLERVEREAALRDDIWAAMKRGRSTRALQAAKDTPQGIHNIRLKHREGFISIGELACRHAEREACSRAAKSCKTFEAAAAAISVLEQATPALERTGDMVRRWRRMPPKPALGALRFLSGEPAEEEDDDPFDEAFGDWAPAWVEATMLAA